MAYDKEQVDKDWYTVAELLGDLECKCCGQRFDLVLDHINPRNFKFDRRTELSYRAMTKDASNLQILCSKCNNSKGLGEYCKLHSTDIWEGYIALAKKIFEND